MWTPIVNTDRKQGIAQKISEIADVLYESSFNKDAVGLLTGNTGIALFMYQYGVWSEKERYYEKALELISEVITFCRKNETPYSFCNGIAGIGWSLKYLEEQGTIEGNVQEVIDEFFPSLYMLMINLMKTGRYDYLHDALGIALCCYKNEPGNRFLEDLLDEMYRVSHKTGDGIAWYSELTEKETSHRVINLSMSHGLSGIMSILCKLCNKEKALLLLRESARFLVNQQQDHTIYRSCFPSIISETVNYRNSRLAWCYGDLGITVALLQASCILNNTEYRDIALNVLLNCSQRRDVKKEFVMDAGVCHGAAGIAHIFNRVYQNTGDEVFKDAALYWLDDCMQKSRFNDGLAGYKVWRNDGWITKHGILEGIAGIGLVLLSMISNIEPTWDECLLLS